MTRRQETEAERIAREGIKTRHELEVTAVGDFFERERRIEQRHAEIDALTVEQGATAASLADTSRVALLPMNSAGRVVISQTCPTTGA